MIARKSRPARLRGQDAIQFLYDRYVGDDPEQRAVFEAELVNAELAQRVYDLRTAAGLSQRALAKLVGVSVSELARLEAADYEGDAMRVLHRIAAALNRRVEIRLVPIKRRTA